MNKFLLFMYHPHEASGGCNDFIEAFDTLENAIQGMKDNHGGYNSDAQILCIENLEIKSYSYEEILELKKQG